MEVRDMVKQFTNKKADENNKEIENRRKDIEQHHAQRQKSKKTKWVIAISLLAVIIIGSAGFALINSLKPGKYDNFAKCLKEKGAVIYGAPWCEYTKAQKAMFGKSVKYLDYKTYDELPNIKLTPTWVINGQWYERVQDFNRLSALTGCPIK